MKTLELVQGSPEWGAHRLAHDNASDAPTMMGAGLHRNRTALLRERAGVEAPEPHEVLLRVWGKGHTAEAAGRPKAEAIVGEELFPAVGVSDEHPGLSASFDGITMDERSGYECKLWSEELARQIAARELDPGYYWQLEHQAAVANLERIIFAAANEDASVFVWMEYRPQPGRREALLAGWEQFHRDLAAFTPTPEVPAAVGRSPDSLPALNIQVTGLVTASNLAEFKQRAIEVFRGIKTDLRTDQDFADADKTVKWCAEIEDKLQAAKQHALSQTQTIDQLFRTIDDIGAEARAKRLELEKLVKARKEAVRLEIVQRAREALSQHVHGINATLIGVSVQAPATFSADLANAIKGKKTVASLQDAADTCVANAKIATSRFADQVRINIGILDGAEFPTLFADRHTLATTKAPEDLRNLVATRVAAHKAEEQKRAAELRERIRLEEVAKLQPKLPESAPIAPAAVSRGSSAVPPVIPRAAGRGVTRPSDDELIDVIAQNYGVPTSKALEWLALVDISSASQRLVSNL